MLTSACHLVAGNLIIGLIEGLVVSWFVRGRRWRAIGWMVLANYASAWLGYVLLNSALPRALQATGERITIENLVAWHATALLVAYLLTLIVEFPFVWLALGPGVKFGRRVGVNLLVQTVSYALVVAGYVLVSESSIGPWGVVVANPASFARDADVWVYYADESGAVLRTRTSGEQLEELRPSSGSRPDCLRALKRAGGSDWDLYAIWRWPVRRDVLVTSSFSQNVACDPERGDYFDEPALAVPTSSPGDQTPASRPAIEYVTVAPAGDWVRYFAGRFEGTQREKQQVIGGGHPIEGLRVEEQDRWERLFAVETPLAAWQVQYPVVLPSGQFVFQLGDQIVLFDAGLRRIGLLGFGTGLVVTRDPPRAP